MKKIMNGYRILLVEDEIIIADTMKRYLTQQGYQVVGSAISYEEAKDIYLAEKPDMALLDIRLSGSKTGIDVAHFIQGQNEKIPFIYLTSQLDSYSITHAKETFPAGYLTKPIQKGTLYTTIEIAMHNHNAKKTKEETITLITGTNASEVVPINDILFLEADHIYVRVHLVNGSEILQRKSLKELMKQLPSEQFLQSHRSYVCNVNQVQAWDNQNIHIQKKSIPVSRAKRKLVQTQLSKIRA